MYVHIQAPKVLKKVFVLASELRSSPHANPFGRIYGFSGLYIDSNYAQL